MTPDTPPPHELAQLAIKLGIILLVGIAGSYFVRRLMTSLERQRWIKENVWFHAFVTVFSRPAVWGIWFAALVVSLQTVREYFDVEGWSKLSRQINEIGATCLIAWLILAWKQQVELILVKPSRAKKKRSIEKATIDAVGRLFSIFVVLLTALTVLQILEVPIGTFLAVGGIGAAAAAYSSSDIVKNFFGGLMINVMRPFAVGDWISTPDKNIEGTVEDIGWYQTCIRQFDKRPIYVPNGLFPQITVCNPSRMSHRRIREDVGVRYDDFEKVSEIVEDIREMLSNHPEIAQEGVAQMVHMTTYADSSILINIYCFTITTNWAEWRRIQQDVLLRSGRIIEKHGAQIAFPTRTLKLETDAPIHMIPEGVS